MASINTIRRSFVGGFSRLSINNPARKRSEQGNPVTLAAIRDAKEGKMTGAVDTSSLEAFIKTCSE